MRVTESRTGSGTILRCTAKLLKELRVRPADLVEADPGPMGDWFANVRRIERRKCVIFTHAPTLYSFWVAGVMREDFDRFGRFFTESLRRFMVFDNYQPEVVDRAIASMGTIRFGKTNNRSTLGTMTDFLNLSGYEIDDQGGLAHTDMDEVSQYLNRSPLLQVDHFSGDRGMLDFMGRFV